MKKKRNNPKTFHRTTFISKSVLSETFPQLHKETLTDMKKFLLFQITLSFDNSLSIQLKRKPNLIISKCILQAIMKDSAVKDANTVHG